METRGHSNSSPGRARAFAKGLEPGLPVAVRQLALQRQLRAQLQQGHHGRLRPAASQFVRVRERALGCCDFLGSTIQEVLAFFFFFLASPPQEVSQSYFEDFMTKSEPQRNHSGGHFQSLGGVLLALATSLSWEKGTQAYKWTGAFSRCPKTPSVSLHSLKEAARPKVRSKTRATKMAQAPKVANVHELRN